MFDGQHRSFQIQTGTDGSTAEIKINETPGVSAENLSLATWGSSFILANKLHKWKDEVNEAFKEVSPRNEKGEKSIIPILELGAGTSLVGLSSAKIYDPPPTSPNSKTSEPQLPGVIVTDLAPLISGLQSNISANPSLSTTTPPKIAPGILDWWNPSDLSVVLPKETTTISSATHNTPLILAADTVYDSDHPQLLTSTITTWLSRSPSARVILCYVLRHSYIDIIRDLWTQLEEAGLESIEEGQEDPDPDRWDDVAPFEWCVWRWKEEALASTS